MNAKITFFPIGNADTTLIQIAETKKNILWDYANMQGEKHCDLPAEINSRIKDAHFDVVCFTHGDLDHTKGAKDYFFYHHSSKYQGGSRKKIDDLWVPAALLLESRNDLCEDAAILKAEAKHRFLKMKSNVKIFSKPDELKKWVEDNGVSFEEVKHLIVDAGTYVKNWRKEIEGIEFFALSPFKGHVDECTTIDRNNAGIVVQATFGNHYQTRKILGSDIDSEIWKDIVKSTRYHGHEDRLKWDIFHTSHHCSYCSLNKDDKGNTITPTIPELVWVFEEQGILRSKIIIPSDKIPATYENGNSDPVHRQAYNYYKKIADEKGGEAIVLMEYPNVEKPLPLEIDVTDFGCQINKANPAASVIVKDTNSNPRVG